MWILIELPQMSDVCGFISLYMIHHGNLGNSEGISMCYFDSEETDTAFNELGMPHTRAYHDSEPETRIAETQH